MLIDLSWRAPTILTHECTRTIVLRLASVKDLEARVVGHLTLEPVRTFMREHVKMSDYCLSIEDEVGRGDDFAYRVVTARRADRDITSWVQDEIKIEIVPNSKREVWLITAVRESREIVRVYAQGLVPGLIEVGPEEEIEAKSLWQRILED